MDIKTMIFLSCVGFLSACDSFLVNIKDTTDEHVAEGIHRHIIEVH